MTDASLASAAMARLTQQERLAILRLISNCVDPTLASIDRRTAEWRDEQPMISRELWRVGTQVRAAMNTLRSALCSSGEDKKEKWRKAGQRGARATHGPGRLREAA